MGHRDWVRTVAFLPEGKKVKSTSEDGKEISWNINDKDIYWKIDDKDIEIIFDSPYPTIEKPLEPNSDDIDSL